MGGAGRNVRGHINLGTALVIQGRWGDLGRGPKKEPYRRSSQVLRQQVAPAPGERGGGVPVSKGGPCALTTSPLAIGTSHAQILDDCVLPPRKVVLL